jgi:hypothetical protein
MKTSTLMMLGGAAVVGYYLYKKGQPVATTTTPAPTADTSDGSDASAADVAAADDPAQSGANAITPTVIIAQPDDSYDAFYGPGWGWGSPWGSLVAGRGRGGGGHGHRGHR